MTRLLLVDDEPVILEELASFLTKTPGIEQVYTAASGPEAVELIEQFPIDIIVSDIRMPGMTGLELCEYARVNWPMIQCILLSGYAEFEYAQQALKNQVADYLLKPVKKDELLDTIRLVMEKAKEKWAETVSNRKAHQTLRSNLSVLRANLLLDLLRGKRLPMERLSEELDKLDIAFAEGGQAALLMLRVENRFLEYDDHSTSLFEFAVVNIAEEVLNEHYDVWACKDDYHYLVFLLSPKSDSAAPQVEAGMLLERLACQLQVHISAYLNGSISVLVSLGETFPASVPELYQKSLQLFRQLPGSEHEQMIRLWDQLPQTPMRSLQRLYEPPTMLQLMEAHRWKDARQRLDDIFAELNEEGLDTSEHLAEVFFALSNAYSCIVHGHGLQLATVQGEQSAMAGNMSLLRSANLLNNWSRDVLQRLEQSIREETKGASSSFVQQVHQYIERHLAEDVSLQALGSHMHLHPAYISSMYKQETGENLSDYIYRFKMDKASYLLRTSKFKIYEVASQLGYQYTPYFTKLFKNQFGMAPQEYREAQLGSKH
ncbi:response regulator [Paenibacillaceae bacterium]|nr:response regulator [Paenibacillaceae bacterium]